jgi:hypothetical protein
MLLGAFLTGEQVVRLIEHLPALILSLVSLIAAFRAGKKAHHAQQSAETAHEKAAEAAKEQIHFALREAAQRYRPPVQEPGIEQEVHHV